MNEVLEHEINQGACGEMSETLKARWWKLVIAAEMETSVEIKDMEVYTYLLFKYVGISTLPTCEKVRGREPLTQLVWI